MTDTFYFNKKYNFLGENSPRRNTLPREHDAMFKLLKTKEKTKTKSAVIRQVRCCKKRYIACTKKNERSKKTQQGHI